ncbi:hypothetical protein ACI2L1_05855 [Streptomyces sp. NPDC019531]|uniref:hypothetical protein n=1 Tax=Streptomyces sp. NPDC019531 TaxID=3365062 RepID=UPI00384BAC8D
MGFVERSQAGALPPEALRYRSTRLQRVLPVLPLFVVVMGTHIWEWVAGAPSGAEVAGTSGTWAALLFVPLIMNRHFGITLSQSTAIVHNLRRRTIQWAEVQVIRIEYVLGTRTVVIYEADGRRTSLRAPITGFLSWDREFEEKFHKIGRWWLEHRGEDWVPVPPPESWWNAPSAPSGNPFAPPA